MTVLPPGGGAPRPQEGVPMQGTSQPATQTQHVPKQANPDLGRIEKAWNIAVSSCREERKLKLETVPVLLQKITVLENGFEELRKKARAYAQACTPATSEEETSSHSSGEENPMTPEEMQAKLARGIAEAELPPSEAYNAKFSTTLNTAKEEMEKHIERLAQKFNEIGVDESKLFDISSEDSFSYWYHLPHIPEEAHELNLSLWQEQLVNQCVNKFFYVKEVRRIIEANKGEIFARFFPDVNGLDIEQARYKLTEEPSKPESSQAAPTELETHHRGEFPICVTFSLGAREWQFFFKNRDARLDARVIRLIAEINHPQEGAPPPEVHLRTYQIENMGSAQKPFSVWECIIGEKLLGEFANVTIEKMEDPRKRKTLYDQLCKLESICSPLSISDLHPGNLILENLTRKTPIADNFRIVPIDLESIQPGNATGLFNKVPEDKIPALTVREQGLVDTCIKDIRKLPARAVLLTTADFLGGLTRVHSFIEITTDLMTAIQKENWQLSKGQDIKAVIELLILKDFIHHDVPYLTEYESQLYYGRHIDGKLIARR